MALTDTTAGGDQTATDQEAPGKGALDTDGQATLSIQEGNVGEGGVEILADVSAPEAGPAGAISTAVGMRVKKRNGELEPVDGRQEGHLLAGRVDFDHHPANAARVEPDRAMSLRIAVAQRGCDRPLLLPPGDPRGLQAGEYELILTVAVPPGISGRPVKRTGGSPSISMRSSVSMPSAAGSTCWGWSSVMAGLPSR